MSMFDEAVEAAANVYDETAVEAPQDYPLAYQEAMQMARDMVDAFLDVMLDEEKLADRINNAAPGHLSGDVRHVAKKLLINLLRGGK